MWEGERFTDLYFDRCQITKDIGYLVEYINNNTVISLIFRFLSTFFLVALSTIVYDCESHPQPKNSPLVLLTSHSLIALTILQSHTYYVEIFWHTNTRAIQNKFFKNETFTTWRRGYIKLCECVCDSSQYTIRYVNQILCVQRACAAGR